VAINPIKDELDRLTDVAARTEQYGQSVLGAEPALDGALLAKATTAVAAVAAVKTVLAQAQEKLGAGWIPPSPGDFLFVVVAMDKATGVLVAAQSALSDVDRAQHANTGRDLQVWPKGGESKPGVIEQLGTTARSLAVLVGVGALAMVAVALLRR